MKSSFVADSRRLVPHDAHVGGEEISGTAFWDTRETNTRPQSASSGTAAGKITNETGSDNQTRSVQPENRSKRRHVAPNVVLG